MAVLLLFAPLDAADVSEDYRLQAGDDIEIFVWQNPDISRTLTIQNNGEISYILMENIVAAGLTRGELAAKITEKLSSYIETPKVSVIVKKFIRRQVYVIGQIKKPGTYPLKKDMRLLELIALSGSFSDTAKENNLEIIRGDKIIKVNASKIMRRETDDIILEAGDVINVPRTALSNTNVAIRQISPILTFLTTLMTIAILVSL
ncbi:MAG: polysaccharide biosynthesis/export family protein [Elusimicrobia bacterium]|nr:polysaccharide biosynthesis/export family protein [Elusimicrobiota bacterium]